MKKTETNKELELAQEILDMNQKRLTKIEEDINSIVERYKKMMDAEIAALQAEREARMTIIKSMHVVVGTIEGKKKEDLINTEAPATLEEAMPEKPAEPVQEEKPTTEQTVDEEPVIQDTLFPENNEPETETETQAEFETESASEPTEEQTEKLSESDAVSTDEEGFSFGNEENEQEESDDDDNWPDMPTEWQ